MSGTLSASDRDIGDSKAFSITGGAADATLTGYDRSMTGSYGKLYLNSSNGDYRYVPNDTAIEGLKANASESFTLVVTDGSGATASQSLAINITGVAGLNDVLGKTSIPGFCGTCHDTPNVGNHSVKAPLNIGVANAGANRPPALDISGLPVFTLQCTQGPLTGQAFVVTDPGRALITGNCADIGKVKGPILRGLAARAPYFHNGSAATLLDAVNFYDQRFGIGFTDQQKQDLVNFLNSL